MTTSVCTATEPKAKSGVHAMIQGGNGEIHTKTTKTRTEMAKILAETDGTILAVYQGKLLDVAKKTKYQVR